tara:strand:+ start:4540 stop:5466 length:927 start_codon:yes stop_codon:yes gene_type:complete
MKIIFFGNTTFGLPTLDKLNDSNHDILSIVTNKDIHRTKNKLIQTPIKQWSGNSNINLIQQDNLNCSDFINRLKEFNADLFVVIAYKILPKAIFTLPKYGTMNLHASLLPKYRGAAPIQRSILNGDKKTGVSTFIIDASVDTGNIVMQESVNIRDENYGQLHDRLSFIGSDLVISSIKHIKDNLHTEIQPSCSTYAPKIKKSETQIKWDQESKYIILSIRAFSPSPGAFTYLKSKRVRIFEATFIQNNQESLSPGVIKIINKEIIVGTLDVPIKILKVQIEGRGVVDSKSFINGYLNSKGYNYIFETR